MGKDLRHMRHHFRCQDLNSMIGNYPQVCQQINMNSLKNGNGYHEMLNTNEIVKKNTEVNLDGESSINKMIATIDHHASRKAPSVV